MSASFHENIHVALGDLTLQKTIRTSTQRFIVKRRDVVAPEVLPDYQELRTHANQLKQHTLENLDYYLERLESKVQERGGKVLWCADAESATRAVVSIAKEKGIKIAVKSKSMLSEEIGLNEALEKNDLEPVETDLGEFILQLAGERPYHIVAPALHKSRHDVGKLFAEKLGMERSDDPPVLTAEARRVLRAKFLQAGMGISGANFVVAESGAVVLVENEGNIRLTTSLPRVHIAIAGIEKLIPRATDLAVFLKLLGRSATGQPLTSYTSFLSGARRPGEISGPEEFYLLLLDNGRTRILADDEKRQTLYCIRCGACSNVCPVYRRVGGHTYPGAYSGPIGAILTPQFHGAGHEPALPFASSLCGACAEVCPVKIDIPRMLLTLRQETKKVTARELPTRLEKLGFRIWSWVMRNPRLFEQLGFLSKAVLPAPSDGQWIKSLPGPLSEWTGHRDFLRRLSRASVSCGGREGGRARGQTMPDRERILHRIRSGLGRHIDQPPSPPPPPCLVVPPMDPEQCIELLLANFPGVSFRAGSLADAREQVLRILAGRSAVASAAPVLLDAGITSLPGVQSGFTDPTALRDAAANSEVGISGADYALADPGALVLLSSSIEDRLISLLPTIHIAVVPSRVVVSGLDELFTVLPDPAEVSSSMVFIAGPSKTGDIEMKLTLGVHGPREIYLVIV